MSYESSTTCHRQTNPLIAQQSATQTIYSLMLQEVKLHIFNYALKLSPNVKPREVKLLHEVLC